MVYVLERNKNLEIESVLQNRVKLENNKAILSCVINILLLVTSKSIKQIIEFHLRFSLNIKEINKTLFIIYTFRTEEKLF